MKDAPAGILPGDRVGEKYRVERVLGRGGMGVVVRASHEELGHLVAIKVLREGVLDGDEAVLRFMREARALAKLGGDHVVRVSDVGRLENGTPYMVMEYLDGRDLSQILEAQGPLSPEDVTSYLVQACAGLAEAHRSGLVHRDLKPANLFVAERSDGTKQIKVLDFGIAKSIGSTRLTADSMVLGSPRYMSPEQLRSPRDVDARTDIWALGAIAYRLLTNRPAFDVKGIEELVDAMQNDRRPRLGELRTGLPPALVEAVERCLKIERNERFGSVAELAAALAEAGGAADRELAARIARASAPPPKPEAPPAQVTVPFAKPPATPKPILEPTLDDPAPGSAPSAARRPPPSLAPGAEPKAKRSTPRWALLLVAGVLVVVALLVALLSGMLGAFSGYFAGSERSTRKASYDPRRVDPVRELDAAARIAREVEPSCELIRIEAEAVRSGSVDVTSDGLVYYAFQYGLDGGESGWVEITAESDGFSVIRHGMPPRGKPVEPPRCSLEQAGANLVRSGVPQDLGLRFTYGGAVAASRWRVEAQDRAELTREVDATTCAVVPVAR